MSGVVSVSFHVRPFQAQSGDATSRWSCQQPSLSLPSSFISLPESSQWWAAFSNKGQGETWVEVVLDPRSLELRALSGNQVRARGGDVHSGMSRDLGEGLRPGLQNHPLLVQWHIAQSSSVTLQCGEWGVGGERAMVAAVKSFVLELNYTLMEYSPGLLASSHLPHCDYASLPLFLYYLLKIKMCLCRGLRLRAGERSLGFESFLNVPGPLCFSHLTSSLQSVWNKHPAISYLPRCLKDSTRNVFSLR